VWETGDVDVHRSPLTALKGFFGRADDFKAFVNGTDIVVMRGKKVRGVRI
jgi:hypothetical protein